MFGSAPRTPYDLHFGLLGFSVRVHPMFWLVSALLGWRGDRPELTIVWIACVFVSILVHELGHAWMNRRFGGRSEIVLYSLGGYATVSSHSTWPNIAILAAGPGAGFLLWGAVVVVERVLDQTGFGNDSLVRYTLAVLWYVNLVWGLVNLLLPVFPLDGGRIVGELFVRYDRRRGAERAELLSIGASGAIAVWSILAIVTPDSVYFPLGDPKFLAFMFGYLCYLNVMMRQQRMRGPW